MRIAVVDIGGTGIKSGIYIDGVIHDIRETPTNAKQGGEHVYTTVETIIKSYQPFDRIGVSTAGQVDSEKGCIIFANDNIPGYTGVRIKERLTQAFSVPVVVENDVNCAAIGESKFGAGKDSPNSDFLCLTYGTGVGGAIMIGGEVYHGSGFCAGEFGMTITHGEVRDASKDIASGCYERYASTTALVRMAQAVDPSWVSGKVIFEQIDDPRVDTLLNQWVHEVVLGLTNFIHIFNPAMVILGGGVMCQQILLEKVKKSLYQNIMPSFTGVVVKQASLGNTAGLLGAAYLAQK